MIRIFCDFESGMLWTGRGSCEEEQPHTSGANGRRSREKTRDTRPNGQNEIMCMLSFGFGS